MENKEQARKVKKMFVPLYPVKSYGGYGDVVLLPTSSVDYD